MSQMKQAQTAGAEQNLKIQETYSDEFATRVETQAEAAKRHLKSAYESGDPDAMADAQQLLAKAERIETHLLNINVILSNTK